jgi:ribosomal protein S1
MNNVPLERSIYTTEEGLIVIGKVTEIDTALSMVYVQEKETKGKLCLYVNEISNFADVPEQIRIGQTVEVLLSATSKVASAKFIYPEVPGYGSLQ